MLLKQLIERESLGLHVLHGSFCLGCHSGLHCSEECSPAPAALGDCDISRNRAGKSLPGRNGAIGLEHKGTINAARALQGGFQVCDEIELPNARTGLSTRHIGVDTGLTRDGIGVLIRWTRHHDDIGKMADHAIDVPSSEMHLSPFIHLVVARARKSIPNLGPHDEQSKIPQPINPDRTILGAGVLGTHSIPVLQRLDRLSNGAETHSSRAQLAVLAAYVEEAYGASLGLFTEHIPQQMGLPGAIYAVEEQRETIQLLQIKVKGCTCH